MASINTPKKFGYLFQLYFEYNTLLTLILTFFHSSYHYHSIFLIFWSLNAIQKTIKLNKDLDLPTQKEMLAMYRCEEILNEVYNSFSKKLSAFKASLEQGQIIEQFGSSATQLVVDTLSE